MHGANRLGGNSLSDLLVFGARTGAAAAAARGRRRPRAVRGPGPGPDGGRGARARRSSATDGEDPYAIQRDLQEMMQRLVGIFRVEADLDEALDRPGRAAPALGDRAGDRRPRLQPGLEPRLRARPPADDLRGDHPERPAADREPRRPQPARLPGDRRRPLGPCSTASSRRGRDGSMAVDDRRRCRAMPDELRGLLGSGDH